MSSEVLLSENLRLKPLDLERAGDLWRLHQDAAVAHYYERVWSTEDAHELAYEAAMASALGTPGHWVAYRRRTSALVGRGAVVEFDHHGERYLAAGALVRAKFANTDLANEIVSTCLAFARAHAVVGSDASGLGIAPHLAGTATLGIGAGSSRDGCRGASIAYALERNLSGVGAPLAETCVGPSVPHLS